MPAVTTVILRAVAKVLRGIRDIAATALKTLEANARCGTNAVAPHSEDARTAVKSFCEHIAWLKGIHDMYIQLFEREDADGLMRNTAPIFFADFNKILVEYLLLSMARLLEPAQTRGTENFTVANLFQTIAWPPNVMDRLNELNQRLTVFRGYIKTARNKLVAHFDKTAFLGDRTLGEFPKGEDRKALQALEDMCNVMHETALGGIFGEISVAVAGDVLDLKKSLLRSTAFDKLLNNAEDEDRGKLYALLRSLQT